MAIDTTTPRSRRALLLGAVGGGGRHRRGKPRARPASGGCQRRSGVAGNDQLGYQYHHDPERAGGGSLTAFTGVATGIGYGVYGLSPSAAGVYGDSEAGNGVEGHAQESGIGVSSPERLGHWCLWLQRRGQRCPRRQSDELRRVRHEHIELWRVRHEHIELRRGGPEQLECRRGRLQRLGAGRHRSQQHRRRARPRWHRSRRSLLGRGRRRIGSTRRPPPHTLPLVRLATSSSMPPSASGCARAVTSWVRLDT